MKLVDAWTILVGGVCVFYAIQSLKAGEWLWAAGMAFLAGLMFSLALTKPRKKR